MAQIYLSNDYTKYVYNKKRYDSVEELSKAIDEYIVTLPFYWGNYDPSYRECHFMERCIREYMERLGYEMILWDFKSPYKNGHYVIKGVWGEVVSDWAIEVDFDKTTGSIYKFLGDFQWVENKFDGLDNAIGAINSMLIPECLRMGGAMTSVLQKMTTDRAGSISLRSVQGFNVHVEDQKQNLIEKLEEELKGLKESNMEARVKATGKIVEVREEYDFQGEMPDVFYSNEEDPYEVYEKEELDFNVSDNIDPTIDYWEKLLHQYAGMAMLSILQTMPRVSNLDKYMKAAIDFSAKIAHALVEKLKEERK